MSELCYSVRMLRPFVAVIKQHRVFPDEVFEPIEKRDPDERFPCSIALRQLHGAIVATGDEDLGLRAAQESIRGDYAMLEYLAFSARTAREGFQVLGRYIRLLNDAAHISVTEEGDIARIEFESSVPLLRAGTDFGVSVVYEVIKRWMRGPAYPETRVCFRHPRPKDTTEYEKVFGKVRIVFGAPFDGFLMPVHYLDMIQPTADTRLHSLLRRCADQEMGGLPQQSTFAQQVRGLIAKQLSEGRVCADAVAGSLQMSRRTLSRRLDREGTGFRALLDDLRRSLSSRYLIEDGLGVAAVADRLGFGDVAAFHRAFKRWYGTTPHRYRMEHLAPQPYRARVSAPSAPTGGDLRSSVGA